jgi:hypothetical protein
MKTRKTLRGSLLTAFAIVALAACDKEEIERITLSDTSDVGEESTVDSYYQDLDDLGNVAIDAPTDAEYSGRVATVITVTDQRLCDGAVVTIEPGENSTAESPYGVLTVDFGTTGCTDLKGNVRKGKLIFTYSGWRWQTGSTVVLTTNNYSINGVKLEGTRTSENVTPSENDPLKFHVTLENGKATFPDNTVSLRESDIYWSWIRGANPSQDKLIIHDNSTANGTTRGGRTYVVTLLEQLEYQRYCGMAVSGIKKYVIDGERQITIDFGNGTCDRTLVIEVGGVSKEITI